MKHLLKMLSRTWKLVRVLILFKTARDLLRDHFDDVR